MIQIRMEQEKRRKFDEESCRLGTDSIEFTSGSDALVFFGFRFVSALFVVDVLTLFVFFCGRLVPHRLFPSSPLL